MHHTEKTVTIYHREWNAEKGADEYRRTVLAGVSFFSKIATVVSTDGLTASCEGILRIPMKTYLDGVAIQNGDLVCEGDVQKDIKMPSQLVNKCPQVFTVIGITRNDTGREPHIKVVCK